MVPLLQPCKSENVLEKTWELSCHLVSSHILLSFLLHFVFFYYFFLLV